MVQRMARHGASMTIVAASDQRWHASQIVGIISKEHVANSVADSIRPFADSVRPFGS